MRPGKRFSPPTAQGNPYATNQEATQMLRSKLAENMAAGPSREEADRNAQMAMMGTTGAINPWVLGGSIAVPTAIAAVKGYNWLTGGPEEQEQQYQPDSSWAPYENQNTSITKAASDAFTDYLKGKSKNPYDKGGILDEAIYGGPPLGTQ